jgi:solute carrier family 25 (mitochondrial iron transporter), member 28/37
MQVQRLQELVRAEGYQALWHGVSARVLFHVPAAAVCWGVYESMKNLLGARNDR